MVVPPARALWIPARVVHEIQCRSDVAMRTVYLKADAELPYREACAVLDVTPLLRAVILRLVEGPHDDGTRPHLLSLLGAELRASLVVPLHLPEPRDRRLARDDVRRMVYAHTNQSTGVACNTPCAV